jgi:excisionase family DNA binding protein
MNNPFETLFAKLSQIEAMLTELKAAGHTPPGEAQGDVFLNVSEAAEFLKCSRSHIHNLRRRGELPRRRAGGRVLFAKSDLQKLAGVPEAITRRRNRN